MEFPATSRRQARRDAMVLLYQHDITGGALDELYNNLQREEGREIDAFTREEVGGVLARQDGIDSVIDEYAKGWPAHRLAALERNILRIAIYEIEQREDIPYAVTIDEAVELGKRFCSAQAGALINGVLGRLVEADEPGQTPATGE